MTDRETVFSSIVSRLDRGSSVKSRSLRVEQYLKESTPFVVPSYLSKTNSILGLFCDKARASQAAIHELESLEDLSNCVNSLLLAKTSKAEIFLPSNFKDYGLKLSKNIKGLTGTPNVNTNWGLSVALAGVAETGTLIVGSTNTAAITLNMTPENSIVLLAKDQIFANLEEALHQGFISNPRAMICITGPSRTADIAQQLVMGAHGPKTLHVVLVPSLF